MTRPSVVITKPSTPQRSPLRSLSASQDPLVRLVCLPWSGGSASGYWSLAKNLPEWMSVLAVQLPGREDRIGEQPWRRMEQIVEQVADALVPMLDRPLFVFGHSLGALVAHEVAQALRRKTGREPDGLIISGHAAPHRRRLSENPLHFASDDDLASYVRTLGGTPEMILADPHMRRAVLLVLRADFEVLETYVHHQANPLACPMLCSAGTEDLLVSDETLAAWRAYTTSACQMKWFVGDHFYLQSQSAAFAQVLQKWVLGQVNGLREHRN